jgi:polygalacturonase
MKIKHTGKIKKPFLISYYALVFICTSSIVQAQPGIISVRDYGAKGDGSALDTRAIQNAIDECSKNGGGTVVFTPGTYLAGSFELLSNVNIHLEPGSKILASPDMQDYTSMGVTGTHFSGVSFIWARDAENISFTGRGIIDGNDQAFVRNEVSEKEWHVDYDMVRQGKDFKPRMPDGPIMVKRRPGALMMFLNCENILFSGITVQNSPNWCIHLACCKYVDFTGLTVLNSLLVPNTDALDISQSQHVHISGCTLIAGDDGIAISPCSDGMCDSDVSDITVINSTIESRSAAIRIGWSKNDIRNCVFQNLILKSNRGILIQGRQNETIENLIFSDLIINTRLHSGWWGKAEPVHISQIPLDYAVWGGENKMDESALIRNIRFSNLLINSESGILLYSNTPYAIQDIAFEGISMKIRNGKYNQFSGGNFELRPSADRRLNVFAHDIPAFYFRGTKDISIDNYTVDWLDEMPEYYTNAVFGEDFSGFRLSGSSLSLPPGRDLPLVHLKNGERVEVEKAIKPIRKVNIR